VAACPRISASTVWKRMSAAKCFFDTNLLLYLFSAIPEKADKAEELLAEGGFASVQVLNEFASVARRKMHMSYAEISESLQTLMSCLQVMPMTIETHRLGISIAERYGFSVYDSMIVASAMEAGCDQLLTEDLQHSQCIGESLQVINPFT
jgi:predicted nucleic acid-binding protein